MRFITTLLIYYGILEKKWKKKKIKMILKKNNLYEAKTLEGKDSKEKDLEKKEIEKKKSKM